MFRRRHGFTLIEIMIVISIIFILIALLLPAIQATRESARRAQCSSNLMQLGIAMGSYVSTHTVFPPGVVNETGPIRNLPDGYHHSWVVQLLPFMGQQNTYHHFDLKKSVYDIANDTVAGIQIAVLHCPSEGWSSMNYAGCHHDVDAPIAADNHGVLYLNSRIRYDEISDGPAYTILIGEFLTRGRATLAGGLTLGWVSGTRSTLRNTGTRLNERDPFRVPTNPKATFVAKLPRDVLFDLVAEAAEDGSWPVDLTGGFSSNHFTSSNFLFCDGSVRSVNNSVNPGVYRLLGNRADGEMIGSDAY